jgi:thiol-disulfide isomerase/thioredoxin
VLLNDLFESDPKIAALLRSEYELVHINVSPKQQNKEFLASYAIVPQGVPYLVVLDSSGKKITEQETGALENGPKHDPQKVYDFLDKWKATPLDAQKVLDDALSRAGAEKKRVFLHVGAPWCGWCRRLEALLDQPEIASAIEADLIPVKIDTDRMTGGKEVAKKYQTSGGIPWYCVLTPDGKVVATSDIKPGENIGFPTEPAEVDHIVKMLTDGKSRMSDAQVEAMKSAFSKAAVETKQRMAQGH